MDIPDQLRCLFTATVEERDNSYVIEVPEEELQVGTLRPGEMYRIALLSSQANHETEQADTESQYERGQPEPPVDEGEQRTVEIEDLGEQGDGITRVERGFVVIVPDTEVGERVNVKITDVTETVAFAEVIERLSNFG
jgi:predicted RNA-binding protein with TRAM domain